MLPRTPVPQASSGEPSHGPFPLPCSGGLTPPSVCSAAGSLVAHAFRREAVRCLCTGRPPCRAGSSLPFWGRTSEAIRSRLRSFLFRFLLCLIPAEAPSFFRCAAEGSLQELRTRPLRCLGDATGRPARYDLRRWLVANDPSKLTVNTTKTAAARMTTITG